MDGWMDAWEKEIHALLQSLCMKSKGLFTPTARGSLKPSRLSEPGSSQLSTMSIWVPHGQ